MSFSRRRSADAAPAFRLRKALPAATAIFLAACNVPTELPELEQRWIVPLDETRFGVAELLQAGEVDLTPDSSAFVVTFDPTQFQETLGDLCPLCIDGPNVTKPPFIGLVESPVAFPASVTSVTVSSGQVELALDNGLGFDPIRPGGGLTGSVTIELTDSSDGELLASLVIDGATSALPAFSSRVDTLTLSPASIQGTLQARVTVNSPVGDPITLDTSQFVTATATPMDIVVSDVRVDVASEAVDIDPVALDLEDVDQDLADRVRCQQFDGPADERCRITLDVVNPFAVSADFTITITRPGLSDIVKQVEISNLPTSLAIVRFTDEEIRSLLGLAGSELRGSGAISGTATPITVTPGDELVLDARLDLTVLVGG